VNVTLFAVYYCFYFVAAEEMGTVFVLSTIATSSIEQVAAAAPKCNKWFQVYIYKDRSVTEALVRRAEAAGYRALAVTVDAPYFGRRLADVRNKFALPGHLRL
jgi:(S)-2-hydroxy-acid oxidase